MYHSVSLYLCIIFSDTELDSILQICLEIKLVDWFRLSVYLFIPHTTNRTRILFSEATLQYNTTRPKLCGNWKFSRQKIGWNYSILRNSSYQLSSVDDPFFSIPKVASSHSMPFPFLLLFLSHTAKPSHSHSHHSHSH